MTHLRIFECRCEPGEHVFHAPFLAQSYGALPLRSERPGSLRLLAKGDEPTSEVSEILDRLGPGDLSGRETARLFQAALSETLDPDVDGSRFEVGRLPTCPNCGTSDVTYRELDPYINIDLELLRPSTSVWSSLTDEDKESKILAVVRAFLSS